MSGGNWIERRRRFILAFIAVIGVLAVTFGGLYVYGAKAVESLQITCLSVGSGIVKSDIYGDYSVTVPVTYVVHNPSLLPVTATWQITLDYGHGIVISDKRTFDVPTQGKTRAEFNLTFARLQEPQVFNNPNPQAYFGESYQVSLFTFQRRPGLQVAVWSSASISGNQTYPRC